MSTIYKTKDIIADKRYEIIRLIGEGGTGSVYQGRNQQTGSYVAIKVLHNELLEDSRQVEIFKHEAHLAGQLSHPHIVTVHETVIDQKQGKAIYLLVMEYMAEGNLVGQINANIPLELSLKWIKQLLEAIAYAHDKGIIHQDIKSANVFLNSEANVKIGDFGLARLADSSYYESLNLPFCAPSLAQNKGTPAYMSPELCYGELQDERSDIYSLGVLFFELLTGQLPFQAEGMIELARQHISKPVPSVTRLKPALPSILDDIIKRMLAKEKDARYQSTRQILSALQEL